jgi:Excalibur calcium-binding domain
MSYAIPAYLPIAAGFVFVGTWMLTPANAPRPAAALTAADGSIAFPEARGKPTPIPESWRAEKPEDVSPGTRLEAAPRRRAAAAATAVRSAVFYSGCREARAAGAAPIYLGDPGYRPEMDGDNDGIACEPYHPRY